MSQNHLPSATQPQNHVRVNNTLLGAVEKKSLLWFAERMPPWVTPDTLTGVGLLAALVIFLGYALTTYNSAFLWLASLGFALQWFGDSLDGTLARYRKIERPRYGFFIDHAIDGVSEAFIFIGIGLSPYVRFDLALLALVSYLLLSVYVYLVTYVNGVFRISYARLGPTEFRLVAVAANTFVFFAGNPHIQTGLPIVGLLSVTFYDLVTVGVSIVLMVMFAASTIQTAQALSQEDRARAKADRSQKRAQIKAVRDERNRHRSGGAKTPPGKQPPEQENLPIPIISKNR